MVACRDGSRPTCPQRLHPAVGRGSRTLPFTPLRFRYAFSTCRPGFSPAPPPRGSAPRSRPRSVRIVRVSSPGGGAEVKGTVETTSWGGFHATARRRGGGRHRGPARPVGRPVGRGTAPRPRGAARPGVRAPARPGHGGAPRPRHRAAAHARRNGPGPLRVLPRVRGRGGRGRLRGGLRDARVRPVADGEAGRAVGPVRRR